MKKYLILLTVVLTGQSLIAQSQNLKDYYGWEFIEWQSDKNNIEKLLTKKGIEIQNTYSETAYDKITKFQFDDMQTWLYFDSLNKLSHIELLKDFSVVQRKEADNFYEKIKKLLVQKYDEPNTEANDTTNKMITVTWKLKYTEVLFTYDYRYKIIDELGCCSYKVDIKINPSGKAGTSK